MRHKIQQAAIYYKGKIYKGKRHSDCIKAAHKDTGDRPILGIQGFIDEGGYFHNREAAAKIALHHNQIEKLQYSKTELYSEDLY